MQFVESYVPAKCARDPDETRRARLIVHFGFQGVIFGAAYAIFYAAIGHFVGAETVLVCSMVFALVPWILRNTSALNLSGHILVGTMAAGFTQLTLIEGGIHSHAVSWLASVPLCALLVLGLRPAFVWAAVCFLVGTGIGIVSLTGIDLEPLYDPRWRDLVDAAGNLGIIIFLFVLGLVFEVNRARAYSQLQESLEEIVAANEELAHLNNEKTDFLGMAAHDLRNPLTVIIGHADLQVMMPSTSEALEGGQAIGQAGRRMLELITDLLDANAIEEGRYASHVEPHELRDLVRASIHHNQISSERKRIAIDFIQGGPIWVMADRKATLQVLDNLLSNALKYSPLDTRVTISLKNDGEYIRCMIKDQGPGLSADDQKKLFQKHTKLTARPTAGESSVGLGLSIVKRLAEAMGGSVGCESTLGRGATFYLCLKVAVVAPMPGPRAEMAMTA